MRLRRSASQCEVPTQAPRWTCVARTRTGDASEFLLCGGGVPSSSDTAIVALSRAQGVLRSACPADPDPSRGADAGKAATTRSPVWRESPDAVSMASMVARDSAAHPLVAAASGSVCGRGGYRGITWCIAGRAWWHRADRRSVGRGDEAPGIATGGSIGAEFVMGGSDPQNMHLDRRSGRA